MSRSNGRRVLKMTSPDKGGEYVTTAPSDEATELGFYNPHAGLKGRDGGPYLDEVLRERAEVNRAKLEGREPDFENLPAEAGTPLVPATQVIDNSVMSNPSMANHPGFERILTDGAIGDRHDEAAVSTTTPVAVLPVDTRTEPDAEQVNDPTLNNAPSNSPISGDPSVTTGSVGPEGEIHEPTPADQNNPPV